MCGVAETSFSAPHPDYSIPVEEPAPGPILQAGPHLHTHPGAPPTPFLGRGLGCGEAGAATPGPWKGVGECTAGDPYSDQGLKRDTGRRT